MNEFGLENNDTGIETDYIKSELTHFVEFDVVMQSIELFCQPDWKVAWKSKWDWLVILLGKYQEQPTLLNPYLEALITPIANRLLKLMEGFGVLNGTFNENQYQASVFFLVRYCILMNIHIIFRIALRKKSSFMHCVSSCR